MNMYEDLGFKEWARGKNVVEADKQFVKNCGVDEDKRVSQMRQIATRSLSVHWSPKREGGGCSL